MEKPIEKIKENIVNLDHKDHRVRARNAYKLGQRVREITEGPNPIIDHIDGNHFIMKAIPTLFKNLRNEHENVRLYSGTALLSILHKSEDYAGKSQRERVKLLRDFFKPLIKGMRSFSKKKCLSSMQAFSSLARASFISSTFFHELCSHKDGVAREFIGPIIGNLRHWDPSIRLCSLRSLKNLLYEIPSKESAPIIKYAASGLIQNLGEEEEANKETLSIIRDHYVDFISGIANLLGDQFEGEHPLVNFIPALIRNIDPRFQENRRKRIEAIRALNKIISKSKDIGPDHPVMKAIPKIMLTMGNNKKEDSKLLRSIAYHFFEYQEPIIPPNLKRYEKDIRLGRALNFDKIPKAIGRLGRGWYHDHRIRSSVPYSKIRDFICDDIFEKEGVNLMKLPADQLEDLHNHLKGKGYKVWEVDTRGRKINVSLASFIDLEKRIRKGKELAYSYPIGHIKKGEGGPGPHKEGVVYMQPGVVNSRTIKNPTQEICHQNVKAATVIEGGKKKKRDPFEMIFKYVGEEGIKPSEVSEMIAHGGFKQSEVLAMRQKDLEKVKSFFKNTIKKPAKEMRKSVAKAA